MIETKLHKRINITLHPDTLKMINRVASKGSRSQLVDAALRFYVQKVGREKLREQLYTGAIRRGERDQKIAEQWFALD